jgi:hypothetical protein
VISAKVGQQSYLGVITQYKIQRIAEASSRARFIKRSTSSGLICSFEQASFEWLRSQITAAGQRKVAREGGIARRTIERFINGRKVRKAILVKINQAIRKPQ